MKKIIFVFCAAILMSGCIRTDTDVIINKDGSAIVKNDFLIQEDLNNFTDQAFTKSMEDIKSKGAQEITKVHKDGMVGYELINKIASLENEDLRSLPPAITTLDKDKKFINVKKGLFITNYELNLDADLTDTEADSKFAGIGFDKNKMSSLIQANFSVTLPVPASEHNATSVNLSENIYKWSLTLYQHTPIKLKFFVYNTENIVMALVIPLVVLLLLALMYYFKRMKKS